MGAWIWFTLSWILFLILLWWQLISEGWFSQVPFLSVWLLALPAGWAGGRVKSREEKAKAVFPSCLYVLGYLCQQLHLLLFPVVRLPVSSLCGMALAWNQEDHLLQWPSHMGVIMRLCCPQSLCIWASLSGCSALCNQIPWKGFCCKWLFFTKAWLIPKKHTTC